MKSSMRSKFTFGIIFLFLIILILSLFSGIYLNKLEKKTGAILKENYLSVVYAREMTEGIIRMNQEITGSYLLGRKPDSLLIFNEMRLIDRSLQAEKNNITEPGEDKLVSELGAGFTEYCNSVRSFIFSPSDGNQVISLMKKSAVLDQQLTLLSQMNGKAIELKTDDAKKTSKEALTRMTIMGTVFFLIALSFAYSFLVYFNDRFFLFYNGIKEIVSSNYRQRLFLDGKDEFYEISLVFNEMADQLNKNKEALSLTLDKVTDEKADNLDLQELKSALQRIRVLEEKTAALISKLEKS